MTRVSTAEFSIGDRVRANSQNVFVHYHDQNIKVGTEGTVVRVGPLLVEVEWDARWTNGWDGGKPVLNCYPAEVEKVG